MTDQSLRNERLKVPERAEREPQDRVEQLEAFTESLEGENRELIQALLQAYTELMREKIDGSLRGQIIQRLRGLRERLKELEVQQPVEEEPQVIERDPQFIPALIEKLKGIDHLREEDVAIIEKALPTVPTALQDAYIARLESSFKKKTSVEMTTSVAGVAFEVSRYQLLLDQDLERLEPTAEIPPVLVDYVGYRRTDTDFTQTPTNAVEASPIDFDVPVLRDGKPYAYETKSYPRMKYGSDHGSRNQALKYQASIEAGQIAGTTIEVRGRVDFRFLVWAAGASIDDSGAIPGVEIVYAATLPSGNEYRFVLKRSETHEGLQYIQDAGQYSDEDAHVIRGIQKSLADKSVIRIVSEVHVPEAVIAGEREQYLDEPITDAEGFLAAFSRIAGYDRADGKATASVLWKFFDRKKRRPKSTSWGDAEVLQQASEYLGYGVAAEPGRAFDDIWKLVWEEPIKMGDSELFAQYDKHQQEQIQQKFADRVEVVRVSNEKSAVSEYATPEYVERSIREYQDYLRKNPAVAEVKRLYVLEDERIPEAVDRTMEMIRTIAEYENARAADPAEAERRAMRAEMGYEGPEEGVGLDLEHIWIDVIYGMNNVGLDRGGIDKKLPNFLFDPVEDMPGRVVAKFASIEEVEAAAETDIEIARHLALQTAEQKNSIDRHLRAFAKRTEFVRRYDWVERFVPVDQLDEYLEGKDRQYVEMIVEDPTRDKHLVFANTNEERIKQGEYDITRENIRRAERYIQQVEAEDAQRGAGMRRSAQGRLARITARLQAIDTEKKARMKEANTAAKKQAGVISKEMGPLRGELKQLEKLVRKTQDIEVIRDSADRIQELQAAMADITKRRAALFDENRRISAEYEDETRALYSEMEDAYTRVIPDVDWEKMAQRVVEVREQNMMKMIYTITPEGDIMFQEEIFRGDVTGRAAHSELNQGRNTYGAGEAVFVKQGDTWQLTEINNGSGHYRPDATNTLEYAKNLFAQRGVDVSQTKLVDCILRGRKLRNASAF